MASLCSLNKAERMATQMKDVQQIGLQIP